ncbi:MAG: YceI family protein [Thermonemataceae bacterium]
MKIRHIFIFICISYFLFQGLETKAQTVWKVQDSQVSFKIKNAGFWVDGSFKGLEAVIQFDPKTLKGNILASIDASTIDTDNNARDKHLREEDYFHVEKYPKITMKASRFARSKSGNYIGYFSVTIKNTTKEVTVPFTFDGKTMKGYFTIDRRDFGVGGNSIILSDKAKLDITVTLSAT